MKFLRFRTAHQTHPRGLRLCCFTGAQGQVHAEFRPKDMHTSYEGMVHGGVICTLMDEILGWAIALQTERMAFTAELTARFVRPMSPGCTYLATGPPGTDRGRHWEGEGDIRDEHGEIYAKARGKYFPLSAEQTATSAKTLTYQPDDLPVFRDRNRFEDKLFVAYQPRGPGRGGGEAPVRDDQGFLRLVVRLWA